MHDRSGQTIRIHGIHGIILTGLSKHAIIIYEKLPLDSFARHGLGPAQWDAVNLVRSGRKQQ